jgi:hypothetical protein
MAAASNEFNNQSGLKNELIFVIKGLGVKSALLQFD